MTNTDGTFRVGLAFDAAGPFVRVELKDSVGKVVGTVNLHDFNAAMQFAHDVMEVASQAWSAAYRALEAASAAPAVVAVVAIPSKGTVACTKGHLHASRESAQVCEADPKISPMVGAVKH